MGDAADSFSLTTFSRTGKLLPLEYALNAVANGRTTLAICCPTGVVLATDQKLPSSVLVDASAVYKIEAIHETAGMCFAGVGPDYRVLVKRARKSAQAYLRQYGSIQPVRMLVKDVASVCQEYTQRGGVRPFGVSLLIVGLEADGTPALYQVDPSGAYFAWRATAIGKNYVSAKNFLEKRWTADMELDDAIHTALLTLREGFEGEMTAHNIQVAVCRPPAAKSATATTTGTATGMPATISFAVLTPGQIQDYLDEAN